MLLAWKTRLLREETLDRRAVTQKLIGQGRIKSDEVTVVCVTGNGLKTQEALDASFAPPQVIEPHLHSFEEIFSNSITV